ncbi:Protein kinase [Melia azedarach]|nr:Protein kinase [Melia azedarach]
MLQAVKYFHEQGVIHQELRPEYVLVDLDSNTVKLAYIGETFRGDKGPYELGSLSYKAPEYVFGPGNFSTPFTVWSVGCSFVEMITGKPLFDCNDPLLLGGRILRFLCQSNSEGQTKSSTSNKPGDWRANLQFKNLTEEFPGLEPAEVDLLSKMLRFHPDERITIEDALEHEYFNDFQA